jgi:hypothetical protein
MSRRVIIINGPGDREKAVAWVRAAPAKTVLEFRDPARSSQQNARMWAMLSRISRQLCWHGQYYPPEAWKDFFTHALQGERWMPSEEGGYVPIGHSTSQLSVEEHSELTALIEAFAARQGVDL